MIEVDIKFKKPFDTLKLKEYIKVGLEKATKNTTQKIQSSFGSGNTPKVRSGDLRDSIKGNVTESGNTLTATFSSNLIYSRIQEEGGRIHAKGGGYLKFKIQNQWVQVRSVKIPARPYLSPGVENNIETIKDCIIESVIENNK